MAGAAYNTGMAEIYELNCPHCDRAYRLTRDKIEANAGKQIKCRACGQPFVLPGVDAAEEEQAYPTVESSEPVASEPVPVESTEPESPAHPDTAPAVHDISHTDPYPTDDYTGEAAPPAVEYEPDPPAAPPTAPARASSPIATAPSMPATPAYGSSRAPAPTEPASQVIYAMPPQTVEDLAAMRKAMSLWNVLLIVMVVLQLIAAGSMLWIAVRLFR